MLHCTVFMPFTAHASMHLCNTLTTEQSESLERWTAMLLEKCRSIESIFHETHLMSVVSINDMAAL